MSGKVVVRYAGRLWEIEKAPYETEERAHDRAWWIAKNAGTGKVTPELIAESFKWVNIKYFGMKYKDVRDSPENMGADGMGHVSHTGVAGP